MLDKDDKDKDSDNDKSEKGTSSVVRVHNSLTTDGLSMPAYPKGKKTVLPGQAGQRKVLQYCRVHPVLGFRVAVGLRRLGPFRATKLRTSAYAR